MQLQWFPKVRMQNVSINCKTLTEKAEMFALTDMWLERKILCKMEIK